MGMVINTNISSLTAQRHLAESRADMEQAMERLSSGLRINSAMDDAAGLTIAHSLDSKIASLSQAVRNANDGIALVQLAEGAMDEVSAMLTRMKELATQSLNGTYSTSDLVNLDKEYQALSSEIDRIAVNTKFNGVSVINDDASKAFQLGDTSSDTISVTLQRMGAGNIGSLATASITDYAAVDIGNTHTLNTNTVLTAGTNSDLSLKLRIGDVTFTQLATGAIADTYDDLVDQVNTYFGAGTISVATRVLTIAGASFATGTEIDFEEYTADDTAYLSTSGVNTSGRASDALTVINRAIEDVDSYRATLGATANRMEHAANNLMSRVEHQSAARSRIQDADYAVESANLAKAQVLQQAGTAMLAQANASTQNILSLLK